MMKVSSKTFRDRVAELRHVRGCSLDAPSSAQSEKLAASSGRAGMDAVAARRRTC